MDDPLVTIRILATELDLAIPVEFEKGVAAQYERLMIQARLVLDAPVDEFLEPAPVFTP